MALSACGLRGPARAAYRWLVDAQRPDGSWPRTTVDGVVTDAAAESHHAAYIAAGAWHEYLVTGDADFARELWPAVRRGIEWTLALQTPRGEIAWERDTAGRPGEYALLSGCSSILHALRCAVSLAKLAAEPQPDWEAAADRLGHVIAWHPEAFADKRKFSMDWYYPVLGGAIRDRDAALWLASGWSRFVVPGLGVRCVSDQPWVTVAETCELVLALDACGLSWAGRDLHEAIQRFRHHDGSYWTGWQYANENHFPAERSSWTSAAAVLAADALAGFSAGSAVFRATPVSLASHPPTDPESCGCGTAIGA